MSTSAPELLRRQNALRAQAAPGSTGRLWMQSAEWKLVERILQSRHFSKAPTLSAFLRHVSERALTGRAEEITEHRIGVQVFGRAPSYIPSEDNIVRNYARQLRRRLSDYFQDEGRDEPTHVLVPRGGYVPQFLPAANALGVTAEPHVAFSAPVAVDTSGDVRVRQRRRIVLAVIAAVLLCAAALFLRFHPTAKEAREQRVSPRSDMWSVLFSASLDTLVVPADAGLGVLQNISGRRVSLSDYVAGRYDALALPGMDPHAANDLRVQQYTTKVDLEIATRIARLPEVIPDRLALRFARDLRMDELKRCNAVLIGSPYSNPWAEVFQPRLNFRFVYRPELHRSWIANVLPRNGEAAQYENGWETATRTTYATLSLLPNLRGDGHVLLLQGLDVAGTEAASDFALQPARLNPILAQARRPDGSIGPFEVLLRTTNIGSEAPTADVVALRVMR